MTVPFSSIHLTNATRLCIGQITEREAANLRADGVKDDGHGTYLFLASDADPKAPIEILARFLTPVAADRLASLLPV